MCSTHSISAAASRPLQRTGGVVPGAVDAADSHADALRSEYVRTDTHTHSPVQRES